MWQKCNRQVRCVRSLYFFEVLILRRKPPINCFKSFKHHVSFDVNLCFSHAAIQINFHSQLLLYYVNIYKCGIFGKSIVRWSRLFGSNFPTKHKIKGERLVECEIQINDVLKHSIGEFKWAILLLVLFSSILIGKSLTHSLDMWALSKFNIDQSQSKMKSLRFLLN